MTEHLRGERRVSADSASYVTVCEGVELLPELQKKFTQYDSVSDFQSIAQHGKKAHTCMDSVVEIKEM